jgi:hypothetical protein
MAQFVLLAAALGFGQQPEWMPFTSSAGKFRVLFPGEPTEQKESVKTPAGVVEVTTFFVEQQLEQVNYVVTYARFPAAAVKAGSEAKRLDNARDGAVARMKGKLKSEKRIALQKQYPGRELLIETPDKRRVRGRIYAVGDRLYQVLVLGPAAVVDSKETSRFLDSFQLTK